MRSLSCTEVSANCERIVCQQGADSYVIRLNAQRGLSALVTDSAAARRVEAMVARHGPALLRVANQFSLCHDDALDAYQRALEIYLRRLDTVEVATEGAWMRVVVKHEAMAIRRARAQSVERDDIDLDANIALVRDVDEEVAGGERVDRSVEALRALKPDEAKALMLKAHGLSYQEIGRRFGWTYTKTNRAITEGRRRFMKEFKGIEDGEACARYEDVLGALADGTATSAQVVSIRPHLRHCAACRAAVRELRLTRRRRIALLLPWGALISRAELWLQYAGTGGGGRLGAAAALVGVCLSGTGAICIVGTGGPDRPPVIAHRAEKPAAPKHHAKRKHAPVATSTPAATTIARVARVSATPTRRVATKHRKPVAKKSQKDEFGFEGSAASRTPSPPGVTATTASVKSAGGGAGGGHAAKSSTGEFGFEGG
jgi:RNA polymerase sigma factor (sigma-70 family)